MKFLRRITMITCFSLYTLGSFVGVSGEEKASDIYIIKLHGEVNDFTVSYLERELNIAHENKQSVIIDIDTNYALLPSAIEVSNVLMNSAVKTTAYVSGDALSGGMMMAIACDNMAMGKDSQIGYAEYAIYSEEILLWWREHLRTVAQARARPESVVLAMADPDVVIDNYSKEGEVLILSSSQATELGVSDAVCNSTEEVVEYFNLGETFTVAPRSMADRAASALTSVLAMNIFFTLGFMFMIMEIFTAGFGLAGIISIVSFSLYFFGGIIAGSSEWWAMGLFILGAASLLVEMFVPGFGVFGFLGLVLCLLGLIFSSNSLEEFTKRAGIAMIVCVFLVALLIVLKKYTKIEFYDKFANNEVQTVKEGYVINQASDDIMGSDATALTDLRPIGIIELNGKRMDAFSDEGFIQKGDTITVIGKKSSSVVVRKKRT